VFIPTAIACVLAGLVLVMLRPAWYWAFPMIAVSFLAVFAVIIWWEGRA
jgi:hypothetical protein